MAVIFVLLLAGITAAWFLTARFSGAKQVNASAASIDSQRTPVLIELFTSEGCSDCPPADALLQKLDQIQPVKNAEVVVLSEHVDYWDHDGWRDPFSSHAFTERQQTYADRLKLPTPYTPQMVVDGESEFVGNNGPRALKEIEKAAANATVRVAISSARLRDKSTLEAHVQAGALSGASKHAAQVFVGVADESDESQVGAGENSGRHLTHVAVLRELKEVGKVSSTEAFDRDVAVNFDPGKSGPLRVVAFIQEPGQGRVLGVTETRISK
jgi:hypothetical protein